MAMVCAGVKGVCGVVFKPVWAQFRLTNLTVLMLCLEMAYVF